MQQTRRDRARPPGANETEGRGTAWLRVRQQRIRNRHIQASIEHAEDAPIAEAWLSALPDGRWRISHHHIRAEQVPALLAAIEQLRDDLTTFAHDAQAPNAGIVIPFKTRP